MSVWNCPTDRKRRGRPYGPIQKHSLRRRSLGPPPCPFRAFGREFSQAVSPESVGWSRRVVRVAEKIASVRLAETEPVVIVTGFHRRGCAWGIPAGRWASVAQLAEQLICNQQVVGSSPSAGLPGKEVPRKLGRLESAGPSAGAGLESVAVRWTGGYGGGHETRTEFRRRPASTQVTGGFPSGQRGQTVNLMAQPSQVRILHPPFCRVSLAVSKGTHING